MKTQEKLKLCSGCESLYTIVVYKDGTTSSILNCRMTPVFEGRKCPCLKCLVKMRCIINDRDCEDFITYRRSLPVRHL